MADLIPNTDSSRQAGRLVGEVLSSAVLVVGRDVPAASCCSSAELVQPGDLYFALEPSSADAERAIARGAVAVVSEQRFELPGATQYQVASARVALAKFCHELVGQPSRQSAMIGVVGDTAAASTTRLVASALGIADRTPAWWDGRWMSEADGDVADVGAKATAPLVASWLSRSVANGASHAVAGIVPSTGNADAFAACEFETLCLAGTGVRASQGETSTTERQRLMGLIEQLRPGGVIVADAADQTNCKAVAEASRRLLTYRLDGEADVTGEVIERHTNGQTLLVRRGSESVAIETSVIGDAYANSCLAAVAVGLASGLDLQTIARGVQLAPRPPAVLEPVVLGQDFNVFIDAADHADRLRDAAQAVQRTTAGRVLTVLVGGAAETGSRLLSAAAGKSDLVITAREPEPGLAGRPEFRFVEDPFAALALGVALAERGDALLISGVEVDSAGRCPQSETVRELIALRNANTPPSRAA